MKSIFDQVPEDFRLLAIIGTILLITIIISRIANRAISKITRKHTGHGWIIKRELSALKSKSMNKKKR